MSRKHVETPYLFSLHKYESVGQKLEKAELLSSQLSKQPSKFMYIIHPHPLFVGSTLLNPNPQR
jgi:hypothetical protein